MENKRISSSNVLAKECIISALIRLLKDMPLSSISISILCKRAGVSRMTFYRNYSSKEDILIKHLEELFEEYKNADPVTYNEGICWDCSHMAHYFDCIYEHHDFLDALIACGYNMIFFDMLNDYVQYKWSQKADTHVLMAFTGSLFSSFYLWSQSKYSIKQEVFINNLVAIYNR